jgi:hypothetical protein
MKAEHLLEEYEKIKQIWLMKEFKRNLLLFYLLLFVHYKAAKTKTDLTFP